MIISCIIVTYQLPYEGKWLHLAETCGDLALAEAFVQDLLKHTSQPRKCLAIHFWDATTHDFGNEREGEQP